jgi:hypothetical protein
MTDDGIAYQNFVYKPEFVQKVADNVNYAQDYAFTLTGIDLLQIKLDTLKVTAVIVSDSGAAAEGMQWTSADDKQN